jgi:serine/threonine-protein kinase PpkA
VALFEMHKNAPIPKLPENLSHHQHFLERLVSKKPDERFSSAAEAFTALMEYSMGAPESTAAA